MCGTCGCGGADATIEGRAVLMPRRHASNSVPSNYYPPGHDHGLLGAAHAPAMSPERILRIEEDILADNDAQAADNRARFAAHQLFALNFVSSPGSGKTTLLVGTIQRWAARTTLAVVEGDQQTANDAERIRAAGAPAIQVNTGKGCHLDARMISQALDRLAADQHLPQQGLLLIENVGNLVCPAAFDLGEAHKVVILSVTEGEDKPLKYPDLFRAADLLIISKMDLLPYLDFNVDLAIRYARQIRPDLPVICLSSKTGVGCEAWLTWLEEGCLHAQGRVE